MSLCNDQNFKSVVWNIKIFCTNNFFVTVNEYCKRITLYIYLQNIISAPLTQLYWKRVPRWHLLLRLPSDRKGNIFAIDNWLSKSDWEVRSLLFLPRNSNSPFLFGNRGIWVKCVLYWLICNVELHRYKKFYYWAAKKCWCGGDVYRVKQEMMLSRTWNFVLFCLAVTYYRANTNSPGPGVMKREEKLQRH